MSQNQGQPPCHIILFTRYPEPGKVKTRLIPALGEKKAAQKIVDVMKKKSQSLNDATTKNLVKRLSNNAELRHAYARRFGIKNRDRGSVKHINR